MDPLGSIIVRVRPVLAALAAAIALIATAGATRQTPAPAAADAAHARLIALQREATTLLTRAARPDTAADARRTALRDAADRLRTLGAEPAAGAVTGSASAPAALDADLRAALRRRRGHGERRRRPDSRPDTRLDTAPILALLERARVRLEGEVALGLTFEGGYSQSKVKDPVYGGHATAMGPAAPAPAGGSAATSPVTSPVTFEEAATLPVTAYSGGPGKDHILESGGNGIALLDYDGDGRLDVYVVTGAELSASRAAHRAPQRALPQPGRLALRGRLGEGRRRSRGLGAGRLRRRRRRRRTHRPLRHQLGRQRRCSATRATAPSRTSRRRPASRPAAGARAARSSTPTPTAISTCTSRAT